MPWAWWLPVVFDVTLFASGETFSISFEGSVSVRFVGGGVGAGAIGFGAIGFAVGGTTSGSTGNSTVVSSSVEIVSSVGGCAVAYDASRGRT